MNGKKTQCLALSTTSGVGISSLVSWDGSGISGTSRVVFGSTSGSSSSLLTRANLLQSRFSSNTLRLGNLSLLLKLLKGGTNNSTLHLDSTTSSTKVVSDHKYSKIMGDSPLLGSTLFLSFLVKTSP
jgi:hypothetical protein